MSSVEAFISRRFSTDCNWTTGNCYYFAVILRERFSTGSIWYDTVNGHFVFEYEGNFYDWTGSIDVDMTNLVQWEWFPAYDSEQYSRIVAQCVL